MLPRSAKGSDMNPLAKELNDLIVQQNPHVLEMLSDLGKNLFFPKGS